ncbi:MAG TPA: carboxypeptidase-like regulatory domain-containing protein, partial [Edaphobacter sp.]|nr:carboxypeptidase-like regulatory domain-containing protein [Edaphobacter sp.]
MMRFRNAISLALAAALILMIGLSSTPADAQGITATIAGVVSDATGGVAAGAQVTATRLDTNEDRIATTTNTGEFIIPLLQPGRYRVTVEMASFKTYQQELTLEINQKV